MPGKGYYIKRKERVIWTAIWLVYCGLIVTLSVLPGRTVEPFFFFPGQDKIAHVLKYAGLAFCTDWCLRFHKGQWNRVQWLFILGFVLLFGFHDEIQQSYVSGRTTSLGDVAADFAGAIVYLLLAKQKIFEDMVTQRLISWAQKVNK